MTDFFSMMLLNKISQLRSDFGVIFRQKDGFRSSCEQLGPRKIALTTH